MIKVAGFTHGIAYPPIPVAASIIIANQEKLCDFEKCQQLRYHDHQSVGLEHECQ